MKIYFDRYIYIFFLFVILTGGRFFIPLTVLFFLIYLNKKLFVDKKLILNDIILLSIFSLFYPIQAILNPSVNLFNLDIVEWKVYLVIIIYGLLAIEEKNKENYNMRSDPNLGYRLGTPLLLSLLTFTFICLFQVFPWIYRFADYAPAASRIISTYFGFACLLSTSLIKNIYLKIIGIILALIGGGGSITISLMIYISTFFVFKESNNQKKKLRTILISLIISLFVFLPIFQYSQFRRQRSIAEFQNIDRYIIFNYVFKYIGDNFKFEDYLFGKGPDSNVELGAIMQQYTLSKREVQIGKYLLNESDTVSGKNFHNDYLRIFSHFGLFGVFIFLRFTYILFSYDIAFYLGFLTLSLVNSIATTTFCASLIIIIFIYKNTFFKFRNNYRI